MNFESRNCDLVFFGILFNAMSWEQKLLMWALIFEVCHGIINLIYIWD